MKPASIRQACDKDAPFLAWVMSTAARSHLDECPWNIIFNETEQQTLKLLESTVQIPELYWSYLSNFLIAEVGGVAVAAMCAFSPKPNANIDLASLQCNVVLKKTDHSKQDLASVKKRLALAVLGLPEEKHDAWGIESVAVLPEFRGKGIIDQLFEHALDKGREKGYKHAQIMCLIGNNQGQKAFERNGFNVVSQKTNAEFEALFGTPGAKLLVQDI